MHKPIITFGFCATTLLVFQACGHDNNGPPPEQAGQSCQVAADCYPGIDPKTLKGEVQCMTRVPGGYCTHLCQTDQDCCAVQGECRTGRPQVCAPFESTGQMFCFLSCDGSEVAAAGYQDSTLYCQQNANAAFGCRSTGGGSANRKICSP